VSRNDLLYLKNLFIFLCHHASASASSSGAATAATAAASVPPAHLNQSQSSAALASPSNLELMALRLPRALVLRHLLSPSFPSLSPAMLERCYAIFDYHGYGSAGLDYSEYLVMMYTLWHGNPHDELARFLFVLCDPGQRLLGHRHHDIIILVAFLRRETETDQAAAEAVELRIEEVAHQLFFGRGGCATSG